MQRLTLVAALLAGALAFAQSTGAPAAEPTSAQLHVPYEKYTLKNGLEVILHEDHRLPLVTVSVWYHVGALNEVPGRSGFAHLFEHMMFQGSQHVADDQHISMLERLGATDLNGTTNFYRTNYFETLPANQVETALWLESDRMGFLLQALTPEKLKTQQEVVKNERRQRYETSPYGLAREKEWQALFPAPHPYHGMVIGSMKDLDAASLEDVSQFFRTWYAPSNATLTVAGDIDKAHIKEVIEKYFATLPSPPKPNPPNVAKVTLEHPVRIDHVEQVATLPMVSVAWLSPALFEPGDAEADVLASILANGKASRLQRRLVREKRIAQAVSAHQQSLQEQSVFGIEATVAPGHTPEEVLKEIDAVLDDIRQKGVTAEEVLRTRNRIETGFVSGLQSIGEKADLLQAYNHFFGEPDSFGRDLARYEQVTPKDVAAFVKNVLTPNRVVTFAVPEVKP
ncbi:MAG: insulinase family protein [Myxococcaceae bacterium]|nr:insulinase family protein [Myxococcaceae bacterium]